MTISAHVVSRTRASRYCIDCRTSLAGLSRVRMYGYAIRGDKPYEIDLCIGCASLSKDSKVAAALAKHGLDTLVKRVRDEAIEACAAKLEELVEGWGSVSPAVDALRDASCELRALKEEP